MATTTTNLGLTKPATSDNVDITVINTNMDKIDTAVGGIPDSFAIVSNGNNHAAIPNGLYVYVRNHSSLSEGLYQATTNIVADATLSASNLIAVSGGGLNAIGGIFKTPDMFNKLTVTVTTTSLGNAVLSQLQATNVIIGIRPSAGICYTAGRSANGLHLVRITDTAGGALANTEVTLDIYYI